MLRVREDTAQDPSCGGPTGFDPSRSIAPPARAGGGRRGRLLAMTAAGLALGMGGAVLTASIVQAEDDADIRAFLRAERARLGASQSPATTQAAYAASRPHAYAPARQGWRIPLFQTDSRGLIAQPVYLNPFRRAEAPTARPRRADGPRNAAAVLVAGQPAELAPARTARTICVRICDGFHAPLGQLRAHADLKAHEALCQAMNPGLPVKVFTVPAGAETIDEARSADGKTYRALPSAYAYQKTGDKACRPAIVKAGERRVSLLRDITLRPGDSVVLDGKVSTFTGGTSWPYSRHDFRDFRSAAELSREQRRQIDERVGISRMEAQTRKLRDSMKIREASVHDDAVMSDAVLRGSLDTAERGPVRLIALGSARP